MKYKIYRLIDPNTMMTMYIGQTEKELYERLISHLSVICRKNIKNRNKSLILWFISLLKDYKIPIIEKIDETDSIEEIDKKEKYWIEFYKNINICLLNISFGGRGLSGVKQSKHRKMKLSKLLGLKIKVFNKSGSLLSIHNSIGEAAKKYKTSKTTISKCIRGLGFSSKKLIFRLENDDFNKYPIKPTYTKRNLKNKKPVLQFDLEGNFIKEFESQSEAAKEIECSLNSIISCISGRLKTCKGFRFKLKN